MQKRWDIFCKVVDNFGDIGVCWRLARQLQTEHGLQIRLWIDDIEAARNIIPSLNIYENNQVCEEITILKWHTEADFSVAAEVVIEAFACEIPVAYLAAMAQKKSKWVNLEYLSAESWVGDFHTRLSPQANGLTRYFYFPGFTETTGGLIRERDVSSQLGGHANPRPQAGLAMTWLMSFVSLVRCLVVPPEGTRQRGRGAVELNLDAAPLSNLSPAYGREVFVVESSEHNLKISLFCYPNAPIKDFFNALQTNSHAVSVYVPESGILPQITDYFGAKTISVGDYFTRENLHVHILPFLSQADYDQLLRDCDLNFVRGEDSWIRAIWAAKPFIWQPYIQDENAHTKKLDAFLDVFYAKYDKKHLLCKAHKYWSAGLLPEDVFAEYLQHLPALKTYTQLQRSQLASQPDLAAKLVIFCNNI